MAPNFLIAGTEMYPTGKLAVILVMTAAATHCYKNKKKGINSVVYP